MLDSKHVKAMIVRIMSGPTSLRWPWHFEIQFADSFTTLNERFCQLDTTIQDLSPQPHKVTPASFLRPIPKY